MLESTFGTEAVTVMLLVVMPIARKLPFFFATVIPARFLWQSRPRMLNAPARRQKCGLLSKIGASGYRLHSGTNYLWVPKCDPNLGYYLDIAWASPCLALNTVKPVSLSSLPFHVQSILHLAFHVTLLFLCDSPKWDHIGLLPTP